MSKQVNAGAVIANMVAGVTSKPSKSAKVVVSKTPAKAAVKVAAKPAAKQAAPAPVKTAAPWAGKTVDGQKLTFGQWGKLAVNTAIKAGKKASLEQFEMPYVAGLSVREAVAAL
jgi:hypothetical protein